MTTLDLQPVLQPVLDVAGLVITGLLTIYIPLGLAAFQKRTGILLSAQQQDKFQALLQTAAGNIETKIDQGALHVAHVQIANDSVAAEAKSILLTAPDLASSLNLTEAGVARAIVGAVDTGSRTPSVAVVAGPGTGSAPADSKPTS